MNYLTLFMEGSPKFWDSLSEFLIIEFSARLDENGRLHLIYPNYFVEKSYTSKVSYSKEWGLDTASYDFLRSEEGKNLIKSLGYKVFSTTQII